MKKLFISATPAAMYLTELPLVAVLVLSIIFNESAGTFPKLYPLIITSAIGIIFTFIYLFRIIIISTEDIRIIGLYSSKDKAIINKNKSIILTLKPRGRIIITLFGNDGERPALDWAQGEDYKPIDINLFREKAEGRLTTAKRILQYFDIPEQDISAALIDESLRRKYDAIDLEVETVDKLRNIKIKFTKTL